MNIAVGVSIAALALAASFVGGYKVRADKCTGDAALIALAASNVATEASKAATAAIGKIRINYTTVKQEVLRETIEKPVYRDCKHEPSVMRSINSSLAGKPVSGSSVPDPQPSE